MCALSPKARGRPATAASPAYGYTGKLPSAVWRIVQLAWEAGIAVSSNMARELSSEIALAASIGWISTISLDGRKHHRTWNVTAEGVIAYNQHQQRVEAP